MIRRFNEIKGICAEKIEGCKNIGFSLSDNTDFYDLPRWEENGGYPGSVLCFYDFEKGEVFTPFEKERNVVYSKPLFIKGSIFFLRGNYTKKEILLYSYEIKKEPKVITKLSMEETELYNLGLMGEDVHIVSQDKEFKCYYPQSFSFKLRPDESVVFIDEDKIYSQEWVEEGWDAMNDCATENYKYYDKLIIRDKEGNILSEEVGSLCKDSDGNFCLS